jgi:hypothetical protein
LAEWGGGWRCCTVAWCVLRAFIARGAELLHDWIRSSNQAVPVRRCNPDGGDVIG